MKRRRYEQGMVLMLWRKLRNGGLEHIFLFLFLFFFSFLSSHPFFLSIATCLLQPQRQGFKEVALANLRQAEFGPLNRQKVDLGCLLLTQVTGGGIGVPLLMLQHHFSVGLALRISGYAISLFVAPICLIFVALRLYRIQFQSQ